MKKNILFRADSSFKIGTGHIMRDLVLASQYKKDGDTVFFATLNLEGNINHTIKEHQFEIKTLETNHIDEVIQLITLYKIDLIIIDHYDIDFKYEQQLKEKTTVQILSFDDTYEKHRCDILLNHNIYAKTKKYKGLVPKDCEIRCGSKYTLLRDEFIQEKSRKKIQYSEFRILIAMGGADTSNLNIKIVKMLKKCKDIKIDIVTTTANENLQKLQNCCKKNNINLHINSNNMAKLISKSNLCIVTPSVTLNEVYFMDKPFIAIKTSSNQKYMYRYLKKNRYNTLKKFNTKKLKKMFDENR